MSTDGATSDRAAAYSVLVIDDDAAIVRLVRRTLEDINLRTLGAHNGQEALAALESTLPDLIILDLQMPGMDGRACYRQIRQRGLATPVLILSAHGARAAQQELGAEAWLEKPFDLDALEDKVLSLLSASPG